MWSFYFKPITGCWVGRYLTLSKVFFAGTLEKRYGCTVSLFLSLVHSVPKPKINYGGCCLLRGPHVSEDTSTCWASLLPTRGRPISASPPLSAARPSASAPLAGSRVCSSLSMKCCAAGSTIVYFLWSRFFFFFFFSNHNITFFWLACWLLTRPYPSAQITAFL